MKKLTEKILDEVTRDILKEKLNKIRNKKITESEFFIIDRKVLYEAVREQLKEMEDSAEYVDSDPNHKWYAQHVAQCEDTKRKIEYLKTLGNENTRIEPSKNDHSKIDVIQKVGSAYIIDSSDDKYKIRVFKPFGKQGAQFIEKPQSEYDDYLNDFNQNQYDYAQSEYDTPWTGEKGFWQIEFVNKDELRQGKYKQDCLIYDNIKNQI